MGSASAVREARRALGSERGDDGKIALPQSRAALFDRRPFELLVQFVHFCVLERLLPRAVDDAVGITHLARAEFFGILVCIRELYFFDDIVSHRLADEKKELFVTKNLKST